MTKLNAEPFLQVFRGLVEDAEDMLDLGRSNLLGDYEKVSKSVKSRGLRIFFLDLPSACSALEKALEVGSMERRPGEPFTKGGYPNIFLPIYRKIFTDDWLLLSAADPQSIRVLRQLLKSFKKYSIECPQSSLLEKIREFKGIEESLPSPNFYWGSPGFRLGGRFPHLIDLGGDHLRATDLDTRACATHDAEGELRDGIARDLSCIQYVADRIIRSFKFDWSAFKPRHGPGAVSECYRFSKFEFPSWNRRLERHFPFCEWGMLNYACYSLDEHAEVDPPAKLIDVPKDYSGPRLIASEPISSQFVQQGIMNVLRKNVQGSVLRHSIDFTSQEHSKGLALSASLKRDLATIDLSSASDRLSCALVECIFRSNIGLLEKLNAARTPSILYPDGSVCEQKKFAAQGAAFTFPVQSIVYAVICIGVCFSRYSEASLAKLARKVRVYGDDMIVPSDVFPHVCRVLEVLSLKVNEKKSFYNGFFRESCGMDAYYGHDVTVASIRQFFNKRDPATLESVVECANNLYLKGFIRGSSALLDSIPRRTRKSIPVKSSGSQQFGLLGGGKLHHRRRYNLGFQRYEVKVLTVASKVTKTNPDWHSRLFQWFIENPLPESVWIPGEVESVKARYSLRWVDEQLFV